MINVLITGSSGQLGRCIIDALNKHTDKITYRAYTHKELNITDKLKISDILSKNRYDYLINCAAYTDVAGAEQNEEASLLGNAYGPKILAECCSEHNVALIHFSTDYVYGDCFCPVEHDNFCYPLNRYGKTKLLGDTEISNVANKTVGTENELHYMILRISWLYSEYGKNFVKTILRKMKNSETMKVVYDQIGSPTYAGDVARFVVDNVILSGVKLTSGIYHYTNYGSISWYDFAHEICEIYSELLDKENNLNKLQYTIYPVSTDSLNMTVKRPRVTMLSKERTTDIYNINIPYWKESLYKVIKKIIDEGDEDFNV